MNISLSAPSPWSRANSIGRFTGLAERYACYRPDYPDEAVRYVVRRCELSPSSVIVDVGSGTGISSRSFAARGFRVLGIEPNDEMRQRADIEPLLPDAVTPRYLTGTAEATGLPGGSADTVLAAQSFHWFDARLALAEFHRILRPRGWVALLWNTRDDSDTFTAGYNRIVGEARERSPGPSTDWNSGEVLQESPLFQDFVTTSFPHEQILDEEALVGRAFSASYVPRDPEGVERISRALHSLFIEHARTGRVVLRYLTEVLTARRRVSQ